MLRAHPLPDSRSRTRPLRAACLVALLLVAACGGTGSSDPEPGDGWRLLEVNPEHAAYLAAAASGEEVPELMPLRHGRAELAVARGIEPIVPTPPGIGDGICVFPAAHDLRASGRVTPAAVPAFSCGTCWTSATMGSLESNLAPLGLHDFSEAAMQLDWGPSTAQCGQGGNPHLATFYLAAWRGPVDEADYPAPGSPAPVRKHVQNVFLLPDREGPLDNCWIKLAVTHLGGVYSAISRSDWSPNWGLYDAYYHPTADVIHAVTIVGWDDDFDRTKFYCGDPSVPESLRVPPTDGAFIVKDNGGPDWHEDGFFYVSYHDGSIGTMMAAFTGESKYNYGRMYAHDPYGVRQVLVLPGMQKDYSWQANVFTALADEKVVAVSFYELYDADMDFQVQVHLDPVGGPTSPGGPAATADVSLLLPGYFTVPLPQPVAVHEGQRFGVVLRGHDRTGGWPAGIPIETPQVGFPDIAAGPQESYVSVDGVAWKDLTSLQVAGKALADTNVCIKAFTQAPIVVSGAISPDQDAIEWTIQNEGRQPLRVQPVARLFAQAGSDADPLDGDVIATAFSEDGRTQQETSDGWITVQPAAVVTATASDGRIAFARRIRTNAWVLDPVSESATAVGIWKILKDLLDDPLEVIATDPLGGAFVNHLGLSQITVTFDQPIQPGPGLVGVFVTSASAVKAVTSVVAGSQLHLYTAGPLGSNQLGGTVWTVHLPADAALSLTSASPLAGPYDLSFTVTGVN